MADGIRNNTFLINAPAGSGKTTTIRNMLKTITIGNSNIKVLCITYTNRAADELKKDLNNSNITVCTIHSYINDLISPFFSEKVVVDLYWNIFEPSIEERIANPKNDEKIKVSNEHYIEKYGSLSKEVVRQNLTHISYGETPFTALYYGKLSHDDLLMFAFKLSEKYPIILKKIYGKYNYIFIDEYQDTSAYVLKLFHTAVKGKTKVDLYLLGDRMQQIYHNYDGSFEAEFQTFDTTKKLDTNHRSIADIISILNNIYNDSNYNQNPSEANKDIKPDIAPRIIISKNPQNTIQAIQKDFPNTLILYLMNKEKYEEIGALNLYQCFDKMEAYSFGKKYSPSDVLSDLSDDNPDPLMKLLFVSCKIVALYNTENFGNIISLCKRQSKFFNTSTFRINKHSDKAILKEKLEQFVAIYNIEESSITNVLDKLQEVEIIKSDALKEFRENEEYKPLFDVKIKEVYNLFEYLNIPTISTQHGVKGESHTSVVFFANDSNNNPNVRMYDFFNLWSNKEFSLTTFEEFYYSYTSDAISLQRQIGIKISDLKKDTYVTNQTIIQNACNAALAKYKNAIFEFICKKDFETYLSKQNVTAARDIFKVSKVEGVLTAYKLFYVGCSRARKNLSIVVDESKISTYKDAFIKKITDIGFVVEFDPTE